VRGIQKMTCTIASMYRVFDKTSVRLHKTSHLPSLSFVFFG